MHNIYLTGMMGSGKTSTARCLAERLQLHYIELDSLIEKRAGKTINKIFKEDGEDTFRKFESELLGETAREKEQVVSTGGGVVISDKNRALMHSTGRIIYLRGSVPVLWDRLRHAKDRPLLHVDDPEGRLRDILKTRETFYEDADFIVNTDTKKPEEVTEDIIHFLSK